MKIVGLMPVRNEQWCVGLSARAALMWCDELVILDHASTDQTRDIIQNLSIEFTGRVFRIWNNDPQWNEMAHRQELLDAARMIGATHIALIDADECVSGNLLPHIREHVEKTPPGRILQVPWLCLHDGINHVMTSGMWGQATVSLAFRDDPVFHWAAQGPEAYQHHHRHPHGREFAAHQPITRRDGGLMHLQFSSTLRLRAKQWAYQLIERERWPNRKSAAEVAAYYGRTVREAQSSIVQPVPVGWWASYRDILRFLSIEDEPWQLAECARIISKNPGIQTGLDDFGLSRELLERAEKRLQ